MYTARITREHRTAFIILSDLSGSMTEEVVFGGRPMPKAEAVAAIINMFIDELLYRCRREDGIRDYFDIAVIGYGRGVTNLLPTDGGFVTPSELARRPVDTQKYHTLRRLPTGNQVSVTTERRYWISARAEGDTPMCAALTEAEKLVRAWCSRPANHSSFPPTVINITDGEASDAGYAQLCEVAGRIKSTGTSDGNTLFFNIHLANPNEEGHVQASFPGGVEDVPHHRYAQLLFDMSSEIPACHTETIMAARPGVTPPLRAMSYNCAVDELFSMLTIGSVSISLIA